MFFEVRNENLRVVVEYMCKRANAASGRASNDEIRLFQGFTQLFT